MTPEEKEQQLFSEGCVIGAEINLEDGSKIRLVSTLKGEQYRLLYRRNEHNTFVICQVDKLRGDRMSLIDPAKYKGFLKQYIKDLYEMDAPMIAGAIERCLQKLEDQPIVDAVEVIRCKSCKTGHTKYGCLWCIRWDEQVEPEDFCSQGERRSI